MSRVDSMIAVRMRVTGHSQEAIEGALRQCAPTIRQNENDHRWDDYAQRTSQYAYSTAGDRQATELAKYRKQWETLEDRKPSDEPSESMALIN